MQYNVYTILDFMKNTTNPRGLTTGPTSCPNGYRLSSVIRGIIAINLRKSLFNRTILGKS